jgi:choline kinase
MSDHIFDEAILTKLMKEKNNNGEVILAVDYNISNNKYVDFDDVIKVLYEQLYRL